MRATRDLLRRRCHLRRKRAEVLAHMQHTNSQYNLPEFGKKLAYKGNRDGVEDHFPDPSVRKTIEMDVALIDHYDKLLGEVERSITRTAKGHDAQSFSRLQSVPGIGSTAAGHRPSLERDCSRFPSDLNRLVRTRMLGGVGRAVSNDRPYPIRLGKALRGAQPSLPPHLGTPALFPGFKNEVEWRCRRPAEARKTSLHEDIPQPSLPCLRA